MVQLLHLADEEAEAQGWRQDGGREMSCSRSLVQIAGSGSQVCWFPGMVLSLAPCSTSREAPASYSAHYCQTRAVNTKAQSQRDNDRHHRVFMGWVGGQHTLLCTALPNKWPSRFYGGHTPYRLPQPQSRSLFRLFTIPSPCSNTAFLKADGVGLLSR